MPRHISHNSFQQPTWMGDIRASESDWSFLCVTKESAIHQSHKYDGNHQMLFFGQEAAYTLNASDMLNRYRCGHELSVRSEIREVGRSQRIKLVYITGFGDVLRWKKIDSAFFIWLSIEFKNFTKKFIVVIVNEHFFNETVRYFHNVDSDIQFPQLFMPSEFSETGTDDASSFDPMERDNQSLLDAWQARLSMEVERVVAGFEATDSASLRQEFAQITLAGLKTRLSEGFQIVWQREFGDQTSETSPIVKMVSDGAVSQAVDRIIQIVNEKTADEPLLNRDVARFVGIDSASEAVEVQRARYARLSEVVREHMPNAPAWLVPFLKRSIPVYDSKTHWGKGRDWFLHYYLGREQPGLPPLDDNTDLVALGFRQHDLHAHDYGLKSALQATLFQIDGKQRGFKELLPSTGRNTRSILYAIQ